MLPRSCENDMLGSNMTVAIKSDLRQRGRKGRSNFNCRLLKNDLAENISPRSLSMPGSGRYTVSGLLSHRNQPPCHKGRQKSEKWKVNRSCRLGRNFPNRMKTDQGIEPFAATNCFSSVTRAARSTFSGQHALRLTASHAGLADARDKSARATLEYTSRASGRGSA
jgi:hypothetical protein